MWRNNRTLPSYETTHCDTESVILKGKQTLRKKQQQKTAEEKDKYRLA